MDNMDERAGSGTEALNSVIKAPRVPSFNRRHSVNMSLFSPYFAALNINLWNIVN